MNIKREEEVLNMIMDYANWDLEFQYDIRDYSPEEVFQNVIDRSYGEEPGYVNESILCGNCGTELKMKQKAEWSFCPYCGTRIRW